MYSNLFNDANKTVSRAKALLFRGFPREEYSFRDNDDLKFAHDCFTYQIRVATVISFIIVVADILGLGIVAAKDTKAFLENNFLIAEGIVSGIMLFVSIAAVKYKVFCVMNSVLYLVSSILLAIAGGTAISSLLCIFCGVMYIKLADAHTHLKIINGFIKYDTRSEIERLVDEEEARKEEMREEAKLFFAKYDAMVLKKASENINEKSVPIENHNPLSKNFRTEDSRKMEAVSPLTREEIERILSQK